MKRIINNEKKFLVLSTLGSLVMASSAMAAGTTAPVGGAAGGTGTIDFLGSITNSTCNFISEQNGVEGNTIDLGTHTIDVVNSASGSPSVKFSLMAKNASDDKCQEKGKSVDVYWAPAAGHWNSGVGLPNTGTAENAAVQLMDGINKKAFNGSYNTVSYTSEQMVSAGNKLAFTANIIKTGADATAGTVVSAAKFAVAYK